MRLQPDLNSGRLQPICKPRKRLRNPRGSLLTRAAGLNSITEDTNSRRAKPRGELGHTQRRVQVAFPLLRVGRVKAGAAAEACDDKATLFNRRARGGKRGCTELRQLPKIEFARNDAQLYAVVAVVLCGGKYLRQIPVRAGERRKTCLHHVIRLNMLVVTRCSTASPLKKRCSSSMAASAISPRVRVPPPPTCGVTIAPGSVRNGWLIGRGSSGSVTSS